MPISRPQNESRSRSQRSRVTNGTDLLPGVDQRSALARRYRDLIDLLTRGFGGPLSDTDRLLIRNAASAQLHVEDLTARSCRGESTDPEAVTRAINGANRALGRLQASRRGVRSDTPVSDYLARRPALEVA
jgi:hypothetical protein